MKSLTSGGRFPFTLLILGASTPAYAHDGGMILLFILLWAGLCLCLGFVSGVAVVLLGREHLSFIWPFVTCLLVSAAVAFVWNPYVIGYGAFAGVLPFLMTYYAGRYVALKTRKSIRSRMPDQG